MMKIAVQQGSVTGVSADVVIVGILQGRKKHRLAAVANLPDVKAFDGKFLATAKLVAPRGFKAGRMVLVGLGEAKALTAERVRRAAGTAMRAALEFEPKRCAVELFADAVEGACPVSPEACSGAISESVRLAVYSFDRYKTAPKTSAPLQSVTLVVSKGALVSKTSKAARDARIVADATCFARDLANLPSNDAHPETIAALVVREARKAGLRTRVFDHRQLEKMGMGGILCVGQGSAHPPRMVVLEHRAASSGASRSTRPTIAIVGKGITFDSGGISIKPGKDMDQMKYDKSGSCAMVGALLAAAQLRLPINVVGLAAYAENMPSGTAYRPGDIITMYSGKTVEVLNTDAEGRMTLADVLAYAEKTYKPDAIIDLATLTGACVVALGHVAMGMFSTDERLAGRLQHASEETGERLWRLPLWDEYEELIKSRVADVCQIGGPAAGTITAACFLKQFVNKTPWAHLDIAGTAWNTGAVRPYIPVGATGSGVRLLVDLLRRWGR